MDKLAKVTLMADYSQLREGMAGAEREVVQGVQDMDNALDRLNTTAERTERGTVESFDKIERSARRTSDSVARSFGARVTGAMNSFKAQIAGVAAAYLSLEGIRSVLRLADESRLLTARLQAMTGSLEAAEAAKQRLLDTANRLRVGYQGLAGDMARMLDPIQRMGGGVAEATALVEIMATKARRSGTSMEAAAAAAFQFSQAVGGGIVRAEEYNSVLDGNLQLAQAMADGMGLTLGQLRAEINAGKVTSDRVVNALLKQYEQIKKEAEDLPVTVGGAWARVTNSFAAMVDKLSSGTPIFTTVADGISLIADFLDQATVSLGEFSDSLTSFTGEGGQGFTGWTMNAKLMVAQLVDIIEAVGQAVAVVTYGLVSGVSGTMTAVQAVGESIKAFFSEIMFSMRSATETAIRAIGGALDALANRDFQQAQSIITRGMTAAWEQFTQTSVVRSDEAAAALAEGMGEAWSELSAGGEQMLNRMGRIWDLLNGKVGAYARAVEQANAAQTGGAPSSLRTLTPAGGTPGSTDADTDPLANTVNQALSGALAAEQAKVQAAERLALMRVNIERDTAETLRSIGATQGQDYLASLTAIAQREYEIRRQSLTERLALLEQDPTRSSQQVQAMHAELEQLETAHQDNLLAIRARTLQQSLQYQNQWVSGIQGGMQSLFQGLATGALETRALGRTILVGLTDITTNVLSQMASSMIANFIRQKLFATTAAMGQIQAYAAQAAAAAYASTAAIPVVGPALAPGAAASAFAGASSFQAALPFAERGWDVPGNVDPLARLHRREMVLPQKQADVIRSMAREGDSVPQSGRAVNASFNFSSPDARGLERLMLNEKRGMRRVLREIMREEGVPMKGRR